MNASITVVKKDGQRYDAENLQVLRKSWQEYEQTVLVFKCSGVLTVFNVEDVERIDFNTSPRLSVAELMAGTNSGNKERYGRS
jgi:hypothetical protein